MGRKGDAIRSNQQKGKANYIGDNARFADFLSVKLTALIDDRLCFQHLGLCYYTPRAPSQTSPSISCNLLYIKGGGGNGCMDVKKGCGGCKLIKNHDIIPPSFSPLFFFWYVNKNIKLFSSIRKNCKKNAYYIYILEIIIYL